MATKKKKVTTYSKAKVIGGALRLREEADLKAKNLCYMAEGEIVEAAPYNKEWMQVKFGDLTGYSMAKFLEVEEVEPEAEPVEESEE